LIGFSAAFDRVDHNILFKKLDEVGVTCRTINIVKLLYHSYHFTLPGRPPQKINSGVAQGSLISPILYNLYVNDLIAKLSRNFGNEHIFAYADDIAVLYLGYSEIREALMITESWAAANGAKVNKKKCGILRITKKETPIGLKDLEGVPFIHEYKYLGVPLDQSVTLKHLVPLIKKKIKAFTTRINLIPHSVVGLKAKLNLWQNYSKCQFEYFAPTIVLCGQLNKFERMYTKSLKKSLDLPMQTPNGPLLKALDVPSLLQIAAHHIVTNSVCIAKRYIKKASRISSLYRGRVHLSSK